MIGLDARLAARLSDIKARLHDDHNGDHNGSLSSNEYLGPLADANAIPTDPNFGWHLGAINIYGAWADYTGAGVTVGVIDDGVNYNHTDLDANYNTAIDWDARDNDADANTTAAGDGHGTKVAGVIAAEANGEGPVGVAYNAEIAGFRIGYGSAGSISQITTAITKAWAVSDVVNSSWGYSTAFQDNFKNYGYSQAGQALADGAIQGRGGLGTVFVFSAGNERSSDENVNYHNFQNSPYTIAVAATTSSGHYASFSDPGAALLVAAPGYSIQTLSDSGGYTTASGTSFSAPIVSGVVALMLEANPDLGARDVQEILAYSAQYNDATQSDWHFNGAGDWNGGGLHFNHNYGFGQVDATNAVRLAETWTLQHTFANQITQTKSSAPNVAIPDGSGSVSDTIHVTQDMKINSVQVDLQIDHTKIGDLEVVLTSPDGTQAVLVNRPGGSGNTANNINFELTANNFWGEHPTGDWTITVYDKATGDVGTLKSWSLILNGDAVTNDNTYVYNNDYATVADAARSTLVDSNGGIDTINAAQITSDSFINLNAGTTSTLAGTPMVIAAGTVIENVYLGDGNDTVIGNAVDNVILGGRGDDTLDGGAGTDTAKFFGSLDHFNVTIVNASTVKVTFTGPDGINEGTDTLSHFEKFDFDGVTYSYDQLASMYGGAAPVNTAPVVAQAIADQATNEDAPFSFHVPAGTFTDADGDALALTAKLADGSALPDWLHFDAGTHTFSGTPVQGDVGAIDIKVTAADPSGAATSDIFQLTVNNVNEAPVLAQAIADQTATENSAFQFALPAGTFTDEDGDHLAFAATLADGSALPSWLHFDGATGTFSGTPGSTDAGALDIKVVANDPSGATASDSFQLTVDATNSAPVVAQAIADQATNEDAPFSFHVPAGTFTDADGDALALTAKLADGSALPDWLHFDAGTHTFSGTPVQGDVGAIDIKVTAADPSGAATSDIFQLTVNNVNEAPVLAQAIADQTATENSAFQFALPAGTFTDEDGDHLAFAATLADGSALPSWLHFDGATGTFSGTPGSTDAGALDIKVVANDPSGATASDSFQLTVDATNSAPVVAQAIADQATNEDAPFSFHVPAGTFTDADGDALALTAKLADGSALPDWLHFDAGTHTFSGTPVQGDVGAIDIKVTAADPSGAATSDIFQLTVNNVNEAPVLAQAIADQTATENSAFQFALPAGTFTDEDGDHLAFAATLADGSALPSWLHFDGATGTFSGTPGSTDAGALDIKVVANDPSGAAASDSFQLTVGATNSAPVVAQAIADLTTNEDAPFSYTVPAGTFTDADGDALALTATLSDGSALPDWLHFDAGTHTFSGTPAQGDVGVIDIKISAADPAGAKASDLFQLTVNNVNDAPVLAQPLADQSVNEDTALLFAIPATAFTDQDGDHLALTATLDNGSALPSWLHFDGATGTFSGTPGNSDVGDIAVKVTATDPSGAAASDSFAITVVNVNDAPVLADPIADQSTPGDTPFVFTLADGTFTDVDNSNLSLTATKSDGSALPDWLHFDGATGTFSGTPTQGDVGGLDIKVTAADAAGAKASDVFHLTVGAINTAPTVALALADQAATEDAAFQFTVPNGTFTDADGDALSLHATLADGSALPSWLTFDPHTNTFSGTPVNADVGQMDIKVTAADPSGATTNDVFHLSVANVNDAPVVTNPLTDQTAETHNNFSYAIPDNSFTDVDAGDVLHFTATEADGSALPSWLTFDAATHTFSGKPANGDVGTFDVRVTATDQAGANTSSVFSLDVLSSNNKPTVNSSHGNGVAHGLVKLSAMFVASDADGDSITQVDLGSQSGATGHWTLDGNAVSGVVSLSDGDLSHLAWMAGDAGTTEHVQLRVFDGQDWSDWATSDVTTPADHGIQHNPWVGAGAGFPGLGLSAGWLANVLNNSKISHAPTVDHGSSAGTSDPGSAASSGGDGGTSQSNVTHAGFGFGWGGLAAYVNAAKSTPLIDAPNSTVNVGSNVSSGGTSTPPDSPDHILTQYHLWSSSLDRFHWGASALEAQDGAVAAAAQIDHGVHAADAAIADHQSVIQAVHTTDLMTWIHDHLSVDMMGITPPDSSPLF